MVFEAKEDISEREAWPTSYCHHTDREQLLLSCTEDLRRRHQELRPARRPLLLVPKNECGLPKMVCTALRPTGFSQPELFLSWQGAAQFVCDHVSYQPLEDPLVLPEQLSSPATVLRTQKGNCFELSVLLASVLVGAWYDAYVVSGYACRELCKGDQTWEDCHAWPEELPPSATEIKEETRGAPKYQVKLEHHFESRYLLERKMKELNRLKEIEDKKREEEDKAVEEKKKPPADDLRGLRVHSWVLVRAGQRGVEQDFFVEPGTGTGYCVEDSRYLGVESVWNDDNYWIYLRGAARPPAGDYQLDDKRLWEALRPGAEPRKVSAVSKPRFLLLSRLLDMPPSWSEPLLLSPSAYERRFPGGSKTQLYRKALLQRWAPHLRPDGQVAELTRYADYERREPCRVLRRYRHREDLLEHTSMLAASGVVTETFQHGRPDFLLVHSYTQSRDLLEHERTMTFNHEVHLDSLRQVELRPLDMLEHFEGREDLLYFRHATFAPAEEGQPRPVLSVTEKFHRNKDKPAVEDIATRTFAISENTISLTYHVAEDNFTANWRTFKKPAGFMFGEAFRFEPHMTRGYQADPGAPEPRLLRLFRLFEEQLVAEDRALFLLRSRQAEVVRILRTRESECSSHKLKISCFDVVRNEDARQAVKLQEQKLEERQHKEMAETEYEELFLPEPSAPVAAARDPRKVPTVLMVRPRADMLRLHLRETVGPDQMLAAHCSCLADFKQLLQRRESSLESRYRKASEELRFQQKLFESQREQFSAREVEDYLERLDAASFHVRCLELLLRRHRQLAPQRVAALQEHLRAAPRS